MHRIFSKEFKQDAQGYSCAEPARSLDVRYNVLTCWIREYKEAAGHAFRYKGNLRPEQEELHQLREAVKQLKMEKEILKKAAVFCADVMCRLMEMNRLSYYRYQCRHKDLPENPERQEMLKWIRKVAEASQ